MFDLAFPEFDKNERYSKLTASLAISAYLRQLLTNQAPFQKWLKGDYNAMSYESKKGALLFFGEAGCYNCHYEKNLGSVTFHAIGVNDLNQSNALPTSGDDKKNLGRGGFTQNEEDNYKFKVPQLYNLKGAAPYFHGSSKTSIEEVVEYFDKAEKENDRVPEDRISSFFKPLNLNAEEKNALVTFLRDGLYDNNIERYVPPYVLSRNCFPNNDSLSRAHMSCE
jgi:cytochrome c peroxidase